MKASLLLSTVRIMTCMFRYQRQMDGWVDGLVISKKCGGGNHS